MFTGIIEGLGRIARIASSDKGMRLTVESDFVLDKTKLGDSIAVNGACLTVVAMSPRRFDADVSPETTTRTTFGFARVGDRVNIERALRLSDRLDGHLVSGHIDGMAVMKSKDTVGNAVVVSFTAPPEMTRYIIEKGSVAVDGISLTINTCAYDGFGVSIIPHTAAITTIGVKGTGDRVNIETDMLGKYVERFLNRKSPGPETDKPASAIDREFLAKAGFL
jgi:riboflavin synthase